jgi:ABC-type hemin transport system substrate-binding protein
MKKFLCVFLFCIAICHAAAAADGKLRVVSLKPTVTDAIVAMGHADTLVGITKYCSVPDDGIKREVVGDYTRVLIERIIALRPDIVIGSEENSSRSSIERLKATGIDVLLLPFSDMQTTKRSIAAIADAIGDTASGQSLISDIDGKLDGLRKRWDKSPKEKILIIWGRRPIVAAGRSSYISGLLPAIGAENAVFESKIPYPRLGKEDIINADPDVIVDLSMGSEGRDSSLDIWSQMTEVRAVREGRIIRMDPNDFRLGPNLASGLGKLAQAIHSR